MDIIVIRYGRKEVWHNRERAKAFYKRALSWCKDSERDRYANIYCDLIDGKDVCKDE